MMTSSQISNSRTGFLQHLGRKGQFRKSWKQRYFVLKASPKDSSGQNLREVIDLTGATVVPSSEITTRFTINLPKNKSMDLEASTDEEAQTWLSDIRQGVTIRNISALATGSRQPEVVDWYYQKQAAFLQEIRVLEIAQTFSLHYYLTNGTEKQSTDIQIEITKSHTGLLFRLLDSNRRLNRVESINDGRELLFRDIESISLANTSPSNTPPNSPLPATIHIVTHEDDLILQPLSDALIEDWMRAVQEAVAFVSIPAPAAADHTERSARFSSSQYGFSVNSGLVYTCAGDVAVIIKALEAHNTKFSSINDLVHILQRIFRLIPEVKCNRDATAAMGERIEDMVRVLGDKHGVISNIKPNDYGILQFNLTTLISKLKDIESFMLMLTQPTWLDHIVHLSDQLQSKFEELDKELMVVASNRIIALHDSSLSFEKRIYETVIDVKRSIEALGGVEVVYNDPAKVKALARLIQSDPAEVQIELENLVVMREIELSDGCWRVCICWKRNSRPARHSRASTCLSEPLVPESSPLTYALKTPQKEKKLNHADSTLSEDISLDYSRI